MSNQKWEGGELAQIKKEEMRAFIQVCIRYSIVFLLGMAAGWVLFHY